MKLKRISLQRMYAAAVIILASIFGQAELSTVSAVTMDFQTLEQNDASYHSQGNSYGEAGFTLSTSGIGLKTSGTSAGYYNGSTAMFQDSIAGSIELTKTGGGAFSIFSIDLSELNGGSQTVVFTGEKSGGATDTVDFLLDGNFATVETFLFGGFFTDLVSLRWVNNIPGHQFDNVRLDVSVVPLPAALPLYGAGLAVLGFVGWRRRSANI